MDLLRINNENIYFAADLYYEVFSSPPWGYEWLHKDKVYSYFTDLYNTPKFIGYVYVNHEKLIGACLGNVSDYFSSVQYYIKEIFVSPKLQNQGIGSLFIKEVEADLIDKGVENITLFTSKTVPAYSFYHKNGYIDSKDSVYMVKFLSLPAF